MMRGQKLRKLKLKELGRGCTASKRQSQDSCIDISGSKFCLPLGCLHHCTEHQLDWSKPWSQQGKA